MAAQIESLGDSYLELEGRVVELTAELMRERQQKEALQAQLDNTRTRLGARVSGARLAQRMEEFERQHSRPRRRDPQDRTRAASQRRIVPGCRCRCGPDGEPLSSADESEDETSDEGSGSDDSDLEREGGGSWKELFQKEQARPHPPTTTTPTHCPPASNPILAPAPPLHDPPRGGLTRRRGVRRRGGSTWRRCAPS